MEFQEYSSEVAAKFLQTVVAVDDLMEFGPPEVIEESEEATELEEPRENLLGSADKPARAINADTDIKHRLNYQELSAEFAEKGIVCSGYKPPENDQECISAIVNTSKNADITILDWQMRPGRTPGTIASKSIQEVAKNDQMDGGRLRLIVIYTAEETDTVYKKLLGDLTSLGVVQYENTLRFTDPTFMHWKISVIEKADKDIGVSEANLIDELLLSFTELTAGLLSNAALAAISNIRDTTHNVLYRFNRNLDPAYISHILGLISQPDMRPQAYEAAADYAFELISDELSTQINIGNSVHESVGKEIVFSWPTSIDGHEGDKFYLKPPHGNNYKKLNSAQLVSLLSVDTDENLTKILVEELGYEQPELMIDNKVKEVFGIEDDDSRLELLKASLNFKAQTLNLSPVNQFKVKPTQITIDSEDTSAMHEFVRLETIRIDRATNLVKNPVLKQGSVIHKKDGTKDDYFLCIQPLCETLRLTGPTKFVLLQFSKSSNPSHIFLKADREKVKLFIDPSSKNIQVDCFKVDENLKTVASELIEGEYVFETESESSPSYIWVGELKNTQTQSIVNKLSSNLSRVGYDSFEWLRMQSR